ncbi:hypothetical protein A2U01_0033911, partial [Trifolium medium]|nr:hypothetical protein [Trifolium medium]
GGKKKKTGRSKGGGEKKNWWEKSGGNSESAWVGKYRILVKADSERVKSLFFVVDLKQQMIVMKHPEVVCSNTKFNSTAVLDKDLTKTPPIWSNWTNFPKMNIKRRLPCSAVLDNNIFVFGLTNIYSPKEEDAEVYQIGGKWEKITIPSGDLQVKPISDPNNNRLIAYFDSQH